MNRRKLASLYGDMVDVLDANGNVIGKKEADDIKNKWFIGHDHDQIWDYEWQGVWQKEEAAEAGKYGLQPGDFKYLDKDGNGVLTDADKTFQGYKTPRSRWTWRNEFSFYKNFSLSFMTYAFWGHYIGFNAAANAGGFPDRESRYAMTYWTPENRSNEYARIGSKNLATHWREGSFVRLENITLSYLVPQHVLKPFAIQNLRISGSIHNVGEYSPHWNWWDPEHRDPTPRTFNLSLNFTL
jgi:hypothetical protein